MSITVNIPTGETTTIEFCLTDDIRDVSSLKALVNSKIQEGKSAGEPEMLTLWYELKGCPVMSPIHTQEQFDSMIRDNQLGNIVRFSVTTPADENSERTKMLRQIAHDCYVKTFLEGEDSKEEDDDDEEEDEVDHGKRSKDGGSSSNNS